MIFDEIEGFIGAPLPASYKEFVAKIEDFLYVAFNEFPEEFPEDNGVDWFFWGESRLSEEVSIEGAGDTAAWNQLSLYAKIDQNFKNRKEVTSDEGQISFERLNMSIAIAEDNGDLLYLDSMSNFSVWVYMHDSGEVKKLCSSFDAWLERASIN
ncbi:SMI1/KNR4 family protein [Sphingomonas sp. NCPPB 2930]